MKEEVVKEAVVAVGLEVVEVRHQANGFLLQQEKPM